MNPIPTKASIRQFFKSLGIECAYSGRRRMWYIIAEPSFKLDHMISLRGINFYFRVVFVESFTSHDPVPLGPKHLRRRRIFPIYR